jgi:hypothetical protein
MKTLTASIALVICSFGFGYAQTEKLQSGDSIRVELQRRSIFKDLTQLRDSMNQSLKIFDSRIQKAPLSKKDKLESARKELIEYQNLVKLDLEETSLTAKNAWRNEYVERIKANTVITRREYKRIRAIL